MVYARMQQKADTSANWAKATNFTPLEGEMIVYTDKNQFKIGDGKTNVNDLPFADIAMQKNGGVVINDGIANGDYSFAAGTVNKEALNAIIGSTASNTVTLNPPTADGTVSLSLGIDTKASSAGSIALGIANISGAKGYYWHTINFDNKTITLSTKRPTLTSYKIEAPTNIDWKEGDYISIENGINYSFCTQIANVSGNIITVIGIF